MAAASGRERERMSELLAREILRMYRQLSFFTFDLLWVAVSPTRPFNKSVLYGTGTVGHAAKNPSNYSSQ